MMPLKHLSKFCRTREMLLTNFRINLVLICFYYSLILILNYVIKSTGIDQSTTFPITDAKLLQQLKSGLKEELIVLNVNLK